MSQVNIAPEDQLVFDRLKSTGRITHGLRRVMTQRWNRCSNCAAPILNGRPAFAGYSADGTPSLLGARCAETLQELATPVYTTGTLNLSIEDNQPVWRYMDFAKFVALLRNGGLYFPRADTLEDRFEGAIGLARREKDWDEFHLDYFRKIVVSPPPGYATPDFTVERIEAEAAKLLKQMKAGSSQVRNAFISCWHANDGESEALWRLYCPPSTTGVAIRSTVGRLWDSCAQETSAVVGRVHYLDFHTAFAGHGRERIFCKRSSLSHEREVRMSLTNDRKDAETGKMLACSLDALICEVVIFPFAPSWFMEVASTVIHKFGYSLKTRQSELLDEPFY